MSTQNFSHKRLASEFKTIEAMLRIYCQAHHRREPHQILCRECAELKNYARRRLQRCPYQESKPTCGNCTIHCYKKDMRPRIKAVMKYAGPRMTYKHPLLALQHLIDSRRKPPRLKKKSPPRS